MKITSRVVLGFSLMILVALVTHLYQVRLLSRMQSADSELAQSGITIALTALRLRGEAAELDEFARKFLALRDPDYLEGMRPIREAVSADIAFLREVQALGDPELAAAVRQVFEDWSVLDGALDNLARSGPSRETEDAVHQAFSQLFQGLAEVTRSADRSLARSGDQIRHARDTLSRVSMWALGVSLLLAGAISAFVYRSISRSLHAVTSVTRKFAAGDFNARIRLQGSDELAEMGMLLNRMARQLGELEQLKRDFVSGVSHDLLAPLASIEETARLVLEDGEEKLEAQHRRLLQLTLSSCARLSAMIAELLDLSRLELQALPYDFQPVDPERTVRDSLEQLHGLVLEKGLEVLVQVPPATPMVRADRTRLAQVVTNLLANAIEHSKPGGRVELAVSTTDRKEGEMPDSSGNPESARARLCLITVTDQGPGIPDSEKDRVFERFYRNRTRAGRNSGAGLGLAIARRIVEDHDGSIWVEDAPHQGSRFCVLLPAV